MKWNKEYWDDIQRVIEQFPIFHKLDGHSLLITGATGMICSVVAEIVLYLNKNGFQIKLYLAGRNREKLMARFEPFSEGLDYTFVYFDALKTQSYDFSFDYIIYGAGNSNPIFYVDEPVETMLSNIVGLNSFLSGAIVNPVKRILYISSSEVYGNRSDNSRPFSESDYGVSDILSVRSCYPSSKRACETLCVSYSSEYKVDTVIVRPGHIYGPTISDHDNRVSAQFTRKVVEGSNIELKSDGLQLRSYCYCLDCASAIIYALLQGKTAQAYNISNCSSIVSIRELADVFAKLSNSKVIFTCPSNLEKIGFNSMNNSSLTSDKLENLGWKALFDIESGVRKTINYYSLVKS